MGRTLLIDSSRAGWRNSTGLHEWEVGGLSQGFKQTMHFVDGEDRFTRIVYSNPMRPGLPDKVALLSGVAYAKGNSYPVVMDSRWHMKRVTMADHYGVLEAEYERV